MTDWTAPEDVPTTTVERLHRWLLQEGNPADAATPGELAVADIIRTFWPVPPRTLAEGLECRADLLDNGDPDGDTANVLRTLATHARQMERDLAEARAEVERLTAVNENLRRTDNYREFREQFLGVQKGAESNAESLDPADVRPGEAWIVEVEGEQRTAMKDKEDPVPWNTISADGWLSPKRNTDIKLLHRLVPAPRVITNADDLDRLAEGAVILSVSTQYALQHGDDGDGWYCPATRGKATSAEVLSCGPITVLWEPGA